MEDVDFWNEYASRRRSPTHPVIRSFVSHKLAEVDRAISGLAGKTVLDVGCGNARFLYHFPTDKKVGIDFSYTMTVHARRFAGEIAVMVADGYALPFQSESFGLVFGGCYLHNLEKPLQAVLEMKRVAKTYVVLVEPNPFAPPIFLLNLLSGEEDRSTVFKFTKEYYRKLLLEAGLSVTCTTCGFTTPNRTPKFLLPVLEKLERVGILSHLGFYFVVVGKK